MSKTHELKIYLKLKYKCTMSTCIVKKLSDIFYCKNHIIMEYRPLNNKLILSVIYQIMLQVEIKETPQVSQF
jgi:hypothetical protein